MEADYAMHLILFKHIRLVVEAGRGKVLVTFCFDKFCAGL
jgi:hypothetical protein